LDVVQFLLDFAHFVVYLPLIFQNFGIVPAEEGHAYHVIGVAQDGLAQDQVLVANEVALLLFEFYLPLKFIQKGIGGIDQAIALQGLELMYPHFGGLCEGVFLFEVVLAVEVGGLYEAD
jgi:hypothetical protein